MHFRLLLRHLLYHFEEDDAGKAILETLKSLKCSDLSVIHLNPIGWLENLCCFEFEKLEESRRTIVHVNSQFLL